MKVCVFGLGYVGCVSVACLARDDIDVVGIDSNPTKVKLLAEARPTVIEQGVEEAIRAGCDAGRITASLDAEPHLQDAAASIICVGTPNAKTGELDVSRVLDVVRVIGRHIKNRDRFHTILIRSTVVPGTNRAASAVVEAESGKKAEVDFAVASYPEFLREGTAVADYYNPPFVVVGTGSDRAVSVVEELNNQVNSSVIKTSVEAAEMIKMVSNSWHALKISFANEVGNICRELGIDSHELMSLFCKDRKLNISPSYLRPGHAYGGSCLPKDLRALLSIAREHYLETPVVDAVERSNEIQKRRLIDIVASTGKKSVGILGLSFKPDTDDLRSSPMVEAAEALLGKGYKLKIYDRNVHMSDLMGTNREYISQHIPHLKELVTDDLNAVVAASDVLVVAHRERVIRDTIAQNPDKIVVDLVRIDDRRQDSDTYHGISW